MGIKFAWKALWIGLLWTTKKIPDQGIYDVYKTTWYLCIIPCFPLNWETTRTELT